MSPAVCSGLGKEDGVCGVQDAGKAGSEAELSGERV